MGWNLLASDPRPLPWIVLFNKECTFHLAPAQPPADFTRLDLPLSFVGVPHHRVLSGARRERPVAERHPGPDCARRHDIAVRPGPVDVLRHGITEHLEATLEVQPGCDARRLDARKQEHDLPRRITDDLVQERFRSVPGFKEAFEAEREALYRAAAEPDPNRLRVLTAEAIALIRERRERFFQGPSAVYGELEDLFLMMEGLGEWLNFKLKIATLGESESQALEASRLDTRNTWTQAEGLVLFLLLDRLVPAWQLYVLDDARTSPVDLLARAGLLEPG